MTLRNSSCACIAALLLMLSAPFLFAAESGFPVSQQGASCELKVRERYLFYDIAGRNTEELQRQMRDNGTKWHDGVVYSAQTTWDIHYSYDVAYVNGRYGVKSADTRVDITYHLPRMVAAGADRELSAVWEKYLGCLERHEFGHKDLAVKTASEINEILASMPTYANEGELAQEITRRAEEKFKRLKEIQVEYDAETRHGETQGAILPPPTGPTFAGA